MPKAERVNLGNVHVSPDLAERIRAEVKATGINRHALLVSMIDYGLRKREAQRKVLELADQVL